MAFHHLRLPNLKLVPPYYHDWLLWYGHRAFSPSLLRNNHRNSVVGEPPCHLIDHLYVKTFPPTYDRLGRYANIRVKPAHDYIFYGHRPLLITAGFIFSFVPSNSWCQLLFTRFFIFLSVIKSCSLGSIVLVRFLLAAGSVQWAFPNLFPGAPTSPNVPALSILAKRFAHHWMVPTLVVLSIIGSCYFL